MGERGDGSATTGKYYCRCRGCGLTLAVCLLQAPPAKAGTHGIHVRCVGERGCGTTNWATREVAEDARHPDQVEAPFYVERDEADCLFPQYGNRGVVA
jgi:hypothetical protein